jgi:hypothetical protein
VDPPEYGRAVTHAFPPIVHVVGDAIVDTTSPGSLVGLYVFGSLATGNFE